MDRDNDAQTNASHNSVPTKNDDPMLREAEDNLLLAKEALRRAQETYDALVSQRPRRIMPSSRKQRQKRGVLTEKEAHAQRQELERRAAKRRQRIQERSLKRTFFNGFHPDAEIERPISELPALFQQVKSLDKFAKILKITRRNAIHALKTAGFDVLEAMAKDWENGQSLRVLSKKHGPMPQTISNWIKSTGREIKPRNSNEKYNRAWMYELFDSGKTTNYIAKTMELSWATVQKCKGGWWHAKTQDV